MRLNKKIKRFNFILLVSFIAISLSITPISEAKETNMRTCNNLHKVKDIDDLLLQFYSNIDNQCLFDMPTQELEKIWGIRVLDYIATSPEKRGALRGNLNREVQKIRANGKGLFVKKVDFEHGVVAFDINLTNKYLEENEGWGGSVGKGKFPELLPPPQRVNDLYEDTLEDMYIPGSKPIAPKGTVYEKYSKYYWLNKAQADNQPVLFIETLGLPRVLGITFYSQARILDFK